MLTINDSGFLFFGILVFNIFALYFICLDSCPWEVCVLSWFACFCNFQFLQFIFLHFSFSAWDEDGKKSPINGSVFPPPGNCLILRGPLLMPKGKWLGLPLPKISSNSNWQLCSPSLHYFFAIWIKLCWWKFYLFVCCLNPAVFAEIHVQVCCLFYICMSLVLFVVWLQPCSLLIWNLWSNPWRGRGEAARSFPGCQMVLYSLIAL